MNRISPVLAICLGSILLYGAGMYFFEQRAVVPMEYKECLALKDAYVVIDNNNGARCFKPSAVVPIK